jgi:hypothetical protein
VIVEARTLNSEREIAPIAQFHSKAGSESA